MATKPASKAGEKKGYWPLLSKLYSSAASLFTFRPLLYGYSNARVRAMRANMLSRRQIEDLLKMSTNAAVAEYLSARTYYREDFAGLPARIGDEERVEFAVSRNFGRVAQKLLRITPDASKDTLVAFLKRYDAHNLKTILLAKKLGKGAEEAASLILPAGTLQMGEIRRILAAKSAEELYGEIKGTAFGREFLSSVSIRHISREQIKAALKSPESSSAQLDILLSAIDSYLFESALTAVKEGEKDASLLASLLRSEADAKNAMTIMRLKRAGADKKDILPCIVEGGNFTGKQIEKMLNAKSVEEAAAVASSFFVSKTGKSEFAAAQKRYKEDSSLSHFEVAFENSLSRKTLHTLRRSTMSIGAIVGFLFLKEEEMNNLRKIVRGKALGLPSERIAEMLVIVG